MSTYCMSDIHGDYERYQKMLELIQFSDNDTLYIIGDVIDRRPRGVDVLLDIMERENVHMLLGNHEHMCLQVFDPLYDLEAHQLWKNNGGSKTYADLKYKRTPSERVRVLRYLRGLPDHFDLEVNGRVFHLVHGYPSDYLSQRLWERPKPEAPAPFDDRIAIIGHTPTYFLDTEDREEDKLKIWYGNGVIDIDCGCGHTLECCCLACLRLDDMAEFYV